MGLAPDYEFLSNLDKRRCVFDIKNLRAFHLGNVQSHREDLLVGLAKMDETGTDKDISKPIQLILIDLVVIEFTTLIAHDHYF